MESLPIILSIIFKDNRIPASNLTNLGSVSDLRGSFLCRCLSRCRQSQTSAPWSELDLRSINIKFKFKLQAKDKQP